MGLSFYFLSDLQIISVLRISGRTVYSNCQPNLAYDLKVKKVWFGLVWFYFLVFGFFSPNSGITSNKVSVTGIWLLNWLMTWEAE